MASARLVDWEDEKRIDRYLGEILKLINVQDDGRVSYSLVPDVDAYHEIITRNVNIKGLKDIDGKRGLVFKAIARFARYSKRTLPFFRRAMETEVRLYFQSPVATFHVLFPINIHRADLAHRRWFTILGTRVCCRSWSYVQKSYDLESFLRAAAPLLRRNQEELEPFLDIYFCPLTISTQARTYREAFKKAGEAFDILRTLMNLRKTIGTATYQFGGRYRPLGQYLPPPVYGVFRTDGSYHSLYYLMENYEYRQQRISEDQIRLVDWFANRLKQPRDWRDTMHLVIEALLKYGQAMDTADWQQAFLALWQILELVALQTAGNVSMREVTSRVANLLRSKENEPLRDLLDVATESRNDLVHRGRFSEDGLREVNHLKVVVDQVIRVLLSRAFFRDFPTMKSLETFYGHTTVNDTDLRERRRVIDRILARRARQIG